MLTFFPRSKHLLISWLQSPSAVILRPKKIKFDNCFHCFQNAVLVCNLKNDRMISVHFQGKPFNIRVIQVYAPTSNTEEAEVEWFYEDLQDLLELTPKKDILFNIRDWNAKVGSQKHLG